MEFEVRTGYYDLATYQHFILDDDELLVNEDTEKIYRVIPDINHGCSEEIELQTTNSEYSEVFGIKEEITLDEFIEIGLKLQKGGVI